jgi:hypothetical protein
MLGAWGSCRPKLPEASWAPEESRMARLTCSPEAAAAIASEILRANPKAELILKAQIIWPLSSAKWIPFTNMICFFLLISISKISLLT